MGDNSVRFAPKTLVERAADSALDAVRQVLTDGQATPVHCFVLIRADDVPEGEQNCTTAGSGYEDEVELIAALYEFFAEGMKALGKEVALVPLNEG